MNIQDLLLLTEISDAAKLTYLLMVDRKAKGQALRRDEIEKQRGIKRTAYFDHIRELRRAGLVKPGSLALELEDSSEKRTQNTTYDPRSDHSNKKRVIGSVSVRKTGLASKLETLEAEAMDRATNRTRADGGRGIGISVKKMEAAWEAALEEKTKPKDLGPLALLGMMRAKYKGHFGRRFLQDGSHETGLKLYQQMIFYLNEYGAKEVHDAILVFYSHERGLKWLQTRPPAWFLNQYNLERHVLPVLSAVRHEKERTRYKGDGYKRIIKKKKKG